MMSMPPVSGRRRHHSDSYPRHTMDLKVLRSFVEIAREQSFTAAAEKLSVTQPTLSRQIADLEEELGQKLFERTTRSLELTEKGHFLFRRAQDILALVDRTKLEAMTTEELAGDIRISAAETPAVGIVAEAVQRFQEKYEASGIHVGEKQPAIPANLRLANSFDGLEMFH